MNKEDFQLGTTFYCGGKKWQCTDMGSRVITAICLSEHKEDESWFNGPPYAVAEIVFDEDDQQACTLVKGDL